MHRPSLVLVLLALVAGCGGGGGGGGGAAGEPGEGPTSAAPTLETVLACLTDAGLDAEDATAGGVPEIAVRYQLDTTQVELRESAEQATEYVEMGETFDFDAFAVGSVYVQLGSLDEDAAADRGTIEGCLS